MMSVAARWGAVLSALSAVSALSALSAVFDAVDKNIASNVINMDIYCLVLGLRAACCCARSLLFCDQFSIVGRQ